ncbi:MAG TPA: glycosyltransferase family 4 protein [Phycisphaerae bacterium]|nr:glycosyltransferase family 4 protein [Phycisphaerae bacterium]HPP27082.1 glycosyltransferase family 4 protein [Phycisphaerae bacterium]HPZ97107.1 glycosyltransferase family 4 protein [Phycisphaerae bacterium]
MTLIRTLYPIYCSDNGIGHICMSLCQHMRDTEMDVRLTVPSSEPSDRREFVRDAVPPMLRTLSCRRSLHGLRHWCTERWYLRQFKAQEIAYIWPGTSPRVYEQLKARGHTIVMERINCHRATAYRILEEAYDQLGWPAVHGIRREHIAEEKYKLELADLVFCPSPLVRQSMLAAGVPAEKLLAASYGWAPERFCGQHRALERAGGITVLFVGLACVRKGIHLLLEAWSRAKLEGRLVLAGDIAADVAARCADQLNRPDVVRLPYCTDVAAVYRSADIFAFPSLEEGSPLVSYEAIASGLACIVSPMGAGEIIRNGREGIVLDPYAVDEWVEALRRLAGDAELREGLGCQARLRAQEYTWQQVGRRRRVALQEALAIHRTAPAEAILVR